jgi:hypothetical protein
VVLRLVLRCYVGFEGMLWPIESFLEVGNRIAAIVLRGTLGDRCVCLCMWVAVLLICLI